MRLPFKFDESNLNEDARVKFTYNSPELHQNIEVSLDAENTSVDSLIDAFERFLCALGVSIPENVALQFIKVNSKGDAVVFDGDEDEEEDEESETDEGEDEDDEDEEEDGKNGGNNSPKKF